MVRRFRAEYIRSEDETGIGIVEYNEKWDRETIAIHSLYVDRKLSNRDASMIIFQRIYNDLDDDEGAVLQMSRFSHRKDWDKPYRRRMNVQKIETIRGRMYQARLLASDALKRKTDIFEIFDDPMKFSVIQHVKEERENGHCTQKKPKT